MLSLLANGYRLSYSEGGGSTSGPVAIGQGAYAEQYSVGIGDNAEAEETGNNWRDADADEASVAIGEGADAEGFGGNW